MSGIRAETSEIEPGSSKPYWWNEYYDEQLVAYLEEPRVSFNINTFKADLVEVWQKAIDKSEEQASNDEPKSKTLPDLEARKQYDFDLDFIISRVQFIHQIDSCHAKKPVLKSAYMKIEPNEMANFDLICEKCLYPHNVYINISGRNRRRKDDLYGITRAGCCGRNRVLMLTVNPWVTTHESSSHASTISQIELRQAIFKRRHDAFTAWKQWHVHAEECEDAQELSTIEKAKIGLYELIQRNGGMSIWSVNKIMCHEILIGYVDSPASTTSEQFSLDDKIDSYAISNDSSSVTDKEKMEKEDMSSRLSLDDD